MEERKLNIYERLSKVTEEVGLVSKDLKVTSYRAVSEGNILSAVKPLEIKYGIYSYPAKRTVIESGFVETKSGTKNYFERIEVIYRFVNIDNPSEYIEITSYGDGIDSGDKSVGKAMTYADKYALMKAYKIETGDDPDAVASEQYKSSSTAKKYEPKKRFVLDKALEKKCEELNIQLERLATYYHKEIVDLTNDDLRSAIERKERVLKAKGEIK